MILRIHRIWTNGKVPITKQRSVGWQSGYHRGFDPELWHYTSTTDSPLQICGLASIEPQVVKAWWWLKIGNRATLIISYIIPETWSVGRGRTELWAWVNCVMLSMKSWTNTTNLRGFIITVLWNKDVPKHVEKLYWTVLPRNKMQVGYCTMNTAYRIRSKDKPYLFSKHASQYLL